MKFAKKSGWMSLWAPIMLLCNLFAAGTIYAQDEGREKSLIGKQIVIRENSEQQTSTEKQIVPENDIPKSPDAESKTSQTEKRAPKQTTRPAITSAMIDAFIHDSCRRHRIDPRLIYAQMRQESSFKLRATSYKGARGLMQLMPGTALRFGVTDIYDPRQNIEAGVKYMRWLLDTFGDIRLALAGYNAGEGAVMKYGNRIPPYRETIQYVEKIAFHYYGERGHGTSFAYNYPLAMRYAREVFPGTSLPFTPQGLSKSDETVALTRSSELNKAPEKAEPEQKTDKTEVGQNDRNSVTEPSIRVLSSSLFLTKDK